MARLPKYMKQIDKTTIGVKWWGVVYLILSRVRWRFFIPFIGLKALGILITKYTRK